MAKKIHDPQINKVVASKKRFAEKYSGEIEKLGYSMAHGVSLVKIFDKNVSESEKDKFCISTLLQPLSETEVNISDDLLERMKDQVLPKEWEGYIVFVKYVEKIVPRS